MADQIEQMGLVLESNQKVLFSDIQFEAYSHGLPFACMLLTLTLMICLHSNLKNCEINIMPRFNNVWL